MEIKFNFKENVTKKKNTTEKKLVSMNGSSCIFYALSKWQQQHHKTCPSIFDSIPCFLSIIFFIRIKCKVEREFLCWGKKNHRRLMADECSNNKDKTLFWSSDVWSLISASFFFSLFKTIQNWIASKKKLDIPVSRLNSK